MAGKGGAVFDRFYGCIDSAARVVPDYHDERRFRTATAIFKARDDVIVGEVAGDPAHKDITERGIEAKFGGDPGVGAAEHGCERILSFGQGFAFVSEIVSLR